MSKKVKKTKKQRKQEQDLTIIGDVQEPFTWKRFWEEQIIGRWRKLKDFLEEKGILFFLMSPFQYRNRLIMMLSLITLSVLLGVVPRAVSLVEQTRERNAESELASINGKQFRSENITIHPLMSSYSDGQHVLAFLIQGSTQDGVPSTADGFNVYLSALRGVSDYEPVKMRYHIAPMDNNNRILLIYTDHLNQQDKTGIYDLNVSVKGYPLMNRGGMEIVLSNTQEETQLFNGVFIDLTALSPVISNIQAVSDQGPIAVAEQKVKDVLETYRLTEDRLLASNMAVDPSYDKVKAWVEENSFLKGVLDSSTTGIVSVPIETAPALTALEALVIGTDGKPYKSKEYNNNSSTNSSKTGFVEAQTAQGLLNNIETALSQLNSQRVMKYKALYEWSASLNVPLLPENFSLDGMIYRSPLEAMDDAEKVNEAFVSEVEKVMKEIEDEKSTQVE